MSPLNNMYIKSEQYVFSMRNITTYIRFKERNTEYFIPLRNLLACQFSHNIVTIASYYFTLY